MIFACIVAGCTGASVPDPELVQTYADVVVARQRYGDSARVQHVVDSILTSRGFERTSFDVALRENARSPELFKAFFDSVSVEITRRRDSLQLGG